MPKIYLLSLLFCLLCVSLPVTAQETTTRTYQPSDENFPNPERGFYIQLAPLWLNGERIPITREDLEAAHEQGITLVRAYYLLELYRHSPLPERVLAALQADFDVLRAEGFKMIPRFAYNFPTNDDYEEAEDAPLEQVLAHIDQLEPLLQANADVIDYMELGFVGAWGEWHSSSNELIYENATLNAASEAIITRLLAALPPERMLGVRYPLVKQELFGADPLTPQEAYQGTPQARLGAHNDCFLASISDWGTYLDDNGDLKRDVFRAYLHEDNRYVVQSGETCNVGEDAQPFIGCQNALTDLAYLRWSSLHLDYHPEVVEGWREEGCFEEIARRLGYRLRLLSAEAPTVLQNQGWLTLVLVNEGFAAPHNPHDFKVLLRNEAGEVYPVRLAERPDLRFWLPDLPEIRLELNFLLNVPSGKYEFLLALPDPMPSLADNPAYAIRLANEGLWEAETGYHALGLWVTVD